MKRSAWNSKMARRLIRTFGVVSVVPLFITLALIGKYGREQILWALGTQKRISNASVRDSGKAFQNVGLEALHQSGFQTEQLSLHAIRGVYQKLATNQTKALSATSRDFSTLSTASIDGAMQQSLAIQKKTLLSVRDQVSKQFARTTEETKQRAAGGVEKAMLSLIDNLMQERARRLAQMIERHINESISLLTITAQLPDLREGNAAGQKAILDSLVRRFPQFTNVSVLDDVGRETAMSASDHAITQSELRAYPNESFFRIARKRGDFIAYVPARVGGEPACLRLSVPIEVYRGKVAGVLTARLSLDDIWEAVQTTRVGRAGYVFIDDMENGSRLTTVPGAHRVRSASAPIDTTSEAVSTIHWRVNVAIPTGEAMEPVEALKRDISRNTDAGVARMDHHIRDLAQTANLRMQHDTISVRDRSADEMKRRSLLLIANLKQTTQRQTGIEQQQIQKAIQQQNSRIRDRADGGMRDAGRRSAADMTAKITRLSQRAVQGADYRLTAMGILILAVSILLSTLLAMVTAGRFVRPVIELKQMAQGIAAGDLDKRVKEGAPDEIGELAEVVNRMAESLQLSHSELHSAEAQLVQSAKLASLGTLSAGVAHELNQPVAIIRGISQQLQDEPGLSDEMKEDLALIEGQTSRMTKIILHLRTFSRVGKNVMEPVDVDKVISDCFILVGEQMRAHNVEVEFNLCGSQETVAADSNELEQVFLNLLTNARDAMDGREGAKITISSRVESGNYVLEIRDNGAGIPDDVIGKVFDPFFTTKEPGKGTGLGLSISHSIIIKHHGELTVHNDNGAVFTVSLPQKQYIEEQELAA